MPTIFSHAAIGFAANRLCDRELRDDPRFLGLSLLLPVLPDVDVIAFTWVPYDHLLGHRGLSHSLLFALVSGLLGAAACGGLRAKFRGGWAGLAAFFFLITATHGLLDAMTTGGLGIAFLSPIDPTRYWLGWRPIPVSAISPGHLLTPYMLKLLLVELQLFGAPCVAAWLYAADRGRESDRGRWRLPLALALLLLGGCGWAARY